MFHELNNKVKLRINEMMYSVEAEELLMVKRLFRFHIFCCLNNWQNFVMEVSVKRGEGIGKILAGKFC